MTAYESVSKILYLLGILASITVVALDAYWLGGDFFYTIDPSLMMPLLQVMNWSYVLFGIGLIGIVLDRRNYLLLVAVVAVFINSLGWILGLMSDILVMGFVWLLAFLFTGLMVWQVRDSYDRFAAPSAILLVIWGLLRVTLDYMRVTVGGAIFRQSVLAGGLFAFLVIFIYMVVNFRAVGRS